jgi:uncharacterized repeat protein (TIGR03803 family)
VRDPIRPQRGVSAALFLTLAVLSGAARGGDLTAIASFNGTSNGGYPSGGVTVDAQGDIFGAAGNTVWEIKAGSNTITTLSTFSFGGSNPTGPNGPMILDSADGLLYGTSTGGGTQANGGTLWLVSTSGSSPAVLASFNPSQASFPTGPLVMDSQGDIFGTAKSGGTGGNGAVWEWTPGRSSITVLGAFNGSGNGGGPGGGLVMDSQGNLFGTTYLGGPGGYGTIWEIKAGTTGIITLASFNGMNGLQPYGNVAIDAQGDLFGTAYGNTLWELKAGSSTITTIATFGGALGSSAEGGVTMDSSGDLFGTTTYAGGHDVGTVWELAAGSQTITTLASFDLTNGGNPQGGVTIGPRGTLYGTASAYGANGYGTVWEFQGAFVSVPEPSTMSLGAIGLALAAVTAGVGQLRNSLSREVARRRS